MKRLLVAGLVFLVSCSKQTDEQQAVAPIQKTDVQTCDFGMRNFNLSKRAPLSDDQTNFIEKPPRGGGSGGGTTTPPSNPVILLDFNGHIVSGTSWNYNGDIVCSPANLLAADQASILQRVSIDYSPFNVTVTTDENLYNSAPVAKRTRVIITESWEWYGQTGGVAFIGSFSWGNNTPCFVFSSLLTYGVKKIAEAASHEAGHTLGLYHISLYDATCTKLSEYNGGQGAGETGWAPIMGVGYYQNLTLWHKGANSNGCTNIQDDAAIITSMVGTKNDDYPNTITNAPTLTSSLNGIINSNADVDYFKISITSVKNISLTPANAGTGNLGGNVDLVLNVYSSTGALINSYDNTSALNAVTTLNAGTYYLSASTVANLYTSNYGMLGNYTINMY